ncbi:Thioredoxin domain-containing protein plp3b [Asimina triloba]
MDPDAFRSTFSGLAFGNVMAAAARDYQKELLAQEKAQSSMKENQEVDLDELMDDPELEKLHADRIAALQKEAEKRQALKRQGHGEYREISEGEFLGEVTSSEQVVCHFYHREFYRCKHLQTKFIKLDAEVCAYILIAVHFKNGVAIERLIGFQDLGGKDDFTTKTLENVLIKKGIIKEQKENSDEDKEEDGDGSRGRAVRSSVAYDSDSD